MYQQQKTLIHSLLILLSTCLLIGFIFSSFSAFATEFEARNGKVIDTRNIPGGIVLKIREDKPSVGGFGYELADLKCSVRNGTELLALNRANIANGEIWYQAKFTKIISTSEPCPEVPFYGWIIGRFANGIDVINLDQVAENSVENPPQNPPEDNVEDNYSSPSPTSDLDNEGAGLKGWSLFIHYFFLSLGAFFGLIVIYIEKADNNPEFDFFTSTEKKSLIARIKDIRKIFWVRLLAILITINIFRFSVLDSLGSTSSENELINAAIQLITQGISGSFIGGLILTVIILKFISFTD